MLTIDPDLRFVDEFLVRWPPYRYWTQHKRGGVFFLTFSLRNLVFLCERRPTARALPVPGYTRTRSLN